MTTWNRNIPDVSMRFIRHSSLVREHQGYSVQKASAFPHRHFYLCFSVITHTLRKSTCWYERQVTDSGAKSEASLLLFSFLKTSNRQLCCHPWLPQESPLSYSFLLCWHHVQKNSVEFLPTNAVSNSEKQNKCTESVYLHAFQMKLYWIYTEVI